MPILKSSDTSTIENYRLIDITSHLANLFESLVLKYINYFVNSILVDEHHGFHLGWSNIICNLTFRNYIMD